ncbi:hypothetical protein [Kribbella deserti]|uniref:Uncharacterized protein n=1 Tax=Kribbella deserti TaxID=1926257 RepID=A0ABV6QR90_9ACTN
MNISARRRWRAFAALAMAGAVAGSTGLATATGAEVPAGTGVRADSVAAGAPRNGLDGSREVGSLEGNVFAADRRADLEGGARTTAATPYWVRYAPLVYLASGDKNYPMSAESFIRLAALRWSHDDGCSDEQLVRSGSINPATLRSGGYKHQGKGGSPGCRHGGAVYTSAGKVRPFDLASDSNEGMFLEIANAHRGGSGVRSPIYVDYIARSHMTFWFFYGNNDSPAPRIADHEGDWERISLRLNASNVPDRVAFYKHNSTCWLSWRSVSRTGTHPIIYSAKGTHASYWKVKNNWPLPYGAVDTTSKGHAWKTWEVPSYAVRARPWYGYGGGWGEVGSNRHSTGPLGPSVYKGHEPNWNNIPACA